MAQDKKVQTGELPFQVGRGMRDRRSGKHGVDESKGGTWNSVVRAAQGNFDHLMELIREVVHGHNSLVDDVSDLADIVEGNIDTTTVIQQQLSSGHRHDHDTDLDGVSANDHHNKLHAHTTADGSGVISSAGPDADIAVDVAGAAGTAETEARSGHGHKLVTSAANPLALGAAAPGTSGVAPSRGDHVHPTTGLALLAAANIFTVVPQRIESVFHQKLELKTLGTGGTPGVPEGGNNYMAFLDGDGDRQGYFGINGVGDFIFAPEVAGAKINLSGVSVVGTNLSLGGKLTLVEDSTGLIAAELGSPGRKKEISADANTSPWDSLNLRSNGSTGGWQGAITFLLSYSGGALYQAMVLRDQGGSSADLSLTGKLRWPVASPDTNIYRSGAGALQTDGTLTVLGSLNAVRNVTTSAQLFVGITTAIDGSLSAAIQLSGNTVDHQFIISVPSATAATRRIRFSRSGLGNPSTATQFIALAGDDKIYFGSLEDTNLYRSAADVLKTDDKLVVALEFNPLGDINHDGSNVGFYGVAPVARPSAYTQTFATADKTHAAFTSANLSAFTGGTVGFLDAAERDNVRTQFNALRADVDDVKQLVNAVIDDLQALGLVQ